MSWLLLKVLMRVEAGLLVRFSPRRMRSSSPRVLLLVLPLRLLVQLLLALVCFGSSSAAHVVRVSRLLSVRDACDTGEGAFARMRG